jgi:hypothetical protein
MDRQLADERAGFDEIFDYVVELYVLTRGQHYSAQMFLLLQQLPDYLPAVVEIIRQALPPGDRGHICLEQALHDIYPFRHRPKRPVRPAPPANRPGDIAASPLRPR